MKSSKKVPMFVKWLWSYLGDIHIVGRSAFDHHTVPPPPSRGIPLAWSDSGPADTRNAFGEVVSSEYTDEGGVPLPLGLRSRR